MTDHPTFNELSELHDDALDVASASVLRAHLATCESCTRQLVLLDTLAHETSALPREIAPPGELWSDIRARIASVPAVRHDRFGGWSVRQLAAAGVLIALGSSALTVALTRRSPDAPAPTVARVVLPASLASEESGFTRSVDVLQRTLAERRDSLAPSTIATVERSLRVADSSIAEARDALARDPSNRALAKLFASNYERKIDLLRRATELAPRT